MNTLPIACHECDLLLHKAEVPDARGVMLCPRCGAELCRVGPDNLQFLLALTCTALILLLLANLFPVVGLNIQNDETAMKVSSTPKRSTNQWIRSRLLLLCSRVSFSSTAGSRFSV